MTTTLGALVIAEPTITRLADLRLPMKTAYQLSKWVRLINAELPFYHKERERLVRELGEPHEDQVTVTQSNMPAFVEAMTALTATAVELAIQPFDLSTLGDVHVTAFELITLEPLLIQDSPDA